MPAVKTGVGLEGADAKKEDAVGAGADVVLAPAAPPKKLEVAVGWAVGWAVVEEAPNTGAAVLGAAAAEVNVGRSDAPPADVLVVEGGDVNTNWKPLG